MKICNTCFINKPLEEYHLASSKKTTRRNKCKVCQAKYIQEYKAKNYEKLKEAWRESSKKYHCAEKTRAKTLKKYGLTVDCFESLSKLQNNKCKICKLEKKLVVDHCHTTNKVRGLLCNQCNTALGLLKDSISNMYSAIDYLDSN